MQDTSDDIPHGLRLILRESEDGYGGANGFIIASVGDGCFIVACVADKVICGWIADQT